MKAVKKGAKSLKKGDSKVSRRQKDRCKTGREKRFLDSPELLNRGGDISEDPPLPRRGKSIVKTRSYNKISGTADDKKWLNACLFTKLIL